jgi:hypothetical protein
MDITIKDIPTEEIANRLVRIALNLVREYNLAQASALSEAEKQNFESAMWKWKIDNNIVEEPNSSPIG